MILLEDKGQQNKKFSVYAHESPSGKKYIGITSQKPNRRWGKNGSRYDHNPAFIKAIKKYGWDNIVHTVIINGVTKEEAELFEIELIKKYKTTDSSFGYNIENGGNCSGTHSEETKKKIGAASKGNKRCLGRKLSEEHIRALVNSRKGKDAPMLGKKLTESAKKKISAANKGKILSDETKKKISKNHANMSGKNNPMYGVHHSEGTKNLIRKKAIGRCISAETRRKMSVSHKKVPVIQIDIEGNVIKRFESCKAAAESIGGNSSNISYVCRGKGKTYKGYGWRYASEDIRR